MVSHFTGAFPVLTGGVGTGFPPDTGKLPDEAKTAVKARTANRDREIIFFINMYYTILSKYIVQITYDCQNILYQ
jgi:hypothetical protein